MARPTKAGLDYFPLDVDIDQDDKIAIIEASHGIEGFAIVIKLLMKIYDNGYFYEWGEKEQLLFARRVNVDINRINVVINDCTKWGIFSKATYKQHQTLTSKGIQRRYLEATTRRKRVEISQKLLLLEPEEVNAYKNVVIVDINPESDELMFEESTQSKVKESKVKESKENQPIIEDIPNGENKENKDPVVDSTFQHIIKAMEKTVRFPTANEIEKISFWIEESQFEQKAVMAEIACGIAKDNGGSSWGYVESILKRWEAAGTDTPDKAKGEIQDAIDRRSNAGNNGKGGTNGGKGQKFDPNGPPEFYFE